MTTKKRILLLTAAGILIIQGTILALINILWGEGESKHRESQLLGLVRAIDAEVNTEADLRETVRYNQLFRSLQELNPELREIQLLAPIHGKYFVVAATDRTQIGRPVSTLELMDLKSGSSTWRQQELIAPLHVGHFPIAALKIQLDASQASKNRRERLLVLAVLGLVSSLMVLALIAWFLKRLEEKKRLTAQLASLSQQLLTYSQLNQQLAGLLADFAALAGCSGLAVAGKMEDDNWNWLVLPEQDSWQSWDSLWPQVWRAAETNQVRQWPAEEATYELFPLFSRGKVQGVLVARWQQMPRRESSYVIQALSGNLALLLDNLRLRQDEEANALAGERLRIAREMHDGIAQGLAYIKIRLNQLGRCLPLEGHQEAAAEIAELVGVVEDLWQEVRSFIWSLKATNATQGLLTFLRSYGQEFGRRHGLQVELHHSGQEPRLPAKAYQQVVRIVQEALHNVAKHARASRVDISLGCAEQRWWLMLADNGQGFDLEQTGANSYGLSIMAERAAEAMVRPRTPSFKDGREVLEHFCLNCHRWQGQGGEIAPDLSQLLRDYTPQRLKQLLKRPANQLMVSVPLGEEETQRLMEYFLEQGLLQGKDRTAETENQKIPAIFRDKQCLLCHRLDGTGGEIGPDLREAYQRNGAAGLKAKLSGSGQSQGMMPVIPLTEKEMAEIIKYLEAKQ